MRLIDADAFRREIDNHWPFTKEEQSKHGIADIAKGTLLYVLNCMPTVEPKQKTGKWIRNDNGTWSCGQCNSWIPDEQHHYARFCLYCGAKMEGSE